MDEENRTTDKTTGEGFSCGENEQGLVVQDPSRHINEDIDICITCLGPKRASIELLYGPVILCTI